MRIVIVGGGSRSAQALRRIAVGAPGFSLTTLVRRPCEALEGETVVKVPDYFDPPEELLRHAEAVVNFAGIPKGQDAALLEEVNVQGPLRLARKMAALGARQLIHISSFHVYGLATEISHATPEAPLTPYAAAKLRADRALLSLPERDLVVSLLRVPMHYGRGAGENIIRLAKLMLRTGMFPVEPRAARRSVLHVDNLATFICALARNPVRGVSFAADDEEFTIELLAEAIGEATGRPPRLIKLPGIAFLPLRWAGRGLYAKLYQSNRVRPEERVACADPLPVRLRAGLVELVSATIERGIS